MRERTVVMEKVSNYENQCEQWRERFLSMDQAALCRKLPELEADEDSVFTTDFTDEKIFSKETALDGQVFPYLSSVNEDVVRNNVGAGNLCHPAVSVKKPRKVIQITVYYDDSTFETFYPENVQ